jgi:AraC family transcriptional regulator
MDRKGIHMDKINQPDATKLLSQQVTGGRYFFLNLVPKRAGPLALVMGGREHCNPDYAISRRKFPFYCLEYVVSGHGSVELDDQQHTLAPGVAFAYAPTTHCEIHNDPDDPMVKSFLCFAGAEAPKRLRRCGVAPGQARLLAARAEITSVLEDLVREGQRSGPLSSPICAALFELLLLKIEDTASLAPHASEPAREAFLRCKALIDANAETFGTLEEIAKSAGVEASSVCRWFRRYQGTSPYRYLMRRKMNIAAEHLVEHGSLVKEVAQRVGFPDPYHFSRAFKSVHGVAPRALLRYRRGSRPAT